MSEIFRIESRALAIAVFYSIGTLAGGFAAPWLFGTLIGSSDKSQVLIGYVIGAFLMAVGGLSELIRGVEAARKSLEAVAIRCRPCAASWARPSPAAAPRPAWRRPFRDADAWEQRSP